MQLNFYMYLIKNKIKDKERIENLKNQLLEVDRLYESLKRNNKIQSQNLEDLRLASESEFNNVKKSEITDFTNLNNRMNELTGLQDIVEQLANQTDLMQKEIEGVRNENSHTPIRLKNKIGTESLTSSMVPSTMLFSNLKNQVNYDNEEIDRNDAVVK